MLRALEVKNEFLLKRYDQEAEVDVILCMSRVCFRTEHGHSGDALPGRLLRRIGGVAANRRGSLSFQWRGRQ